jgi:hypothetical protein
MKGLFTQSGAKCGAGKVTQALILRPQNLVWRGRAGLLQIVGQITRLW